MGQSGAQIAARLALLVLLVGVSGAVILATTRPGTAVPPSPVTPSPTLSRAVLVGAGDIVECDRGDDEATAALVEAIPGTVFTVGDNAYPDGTEREFAECYGPSWGRFRERTRPAPGNHEYHTDGAGPYFRYFGAAAGRPGEGWYSYDLAGWHIVVLNSNCRHVGGCDPGSAQLAWLRADLAASTATCTLAYWHHSRFSSGRYGDDPTFQPFWDALYAAGAEVVVTGHDHQYERFRPQTPSGKADRARGIRAFIVGTGGGSLRKFERTSANSEVRLNEAFGVLRFDIEPDRYGWDFVTSPTGTIVDSGQGVCH